MYFDTGGYREDLDCDYHTSDLISGCMGPDGIESFQWAFIMLDQSDPEKCQQDMMEIGNRRVFNEGGDGVAEAQ